MSVVGTLQKFEACDNGHLVRWHSLDAVAIAH